MTVDPTRRLTAAEACEHPWLSTARGNLAKHDLGAGLEKLKIFNAKRKLRAAIRSVRNVYSCLERETPSCWSLCSKYVVKLLLVYESGTKMRERTRVWGAQGVTHGCCRLCVQPKPWEIYRRFAPARGGLAPTCLIELPVQTLSSSLPCLVTFGSNAITCL